MKEYPTFSFVAEMGVDKVLIYQPTPEAITNFECYLEKNELEFWKNLPNHEQLLIMLCTDPFRGLLMKMGKI
jgi:hypothetical protein